MSGRRRSPPPSRSRSSSPRPSPAAPGDVQSALDRWRPRQPADHRPRVAAGRRRERDAGGRLQGRRPADPGLHDEARDERGRAAPVRAHPPLHHRAPGRPLRGPHRQGPEGCRLPEGRGRPGARHPVYGSAYLRGRATPLAAIGPAPEATGVRLVRGPIVADESLFDRRRLGPGWPSYYSLYIAPLSALAINQDYAGSGRAAYVTSPTLAAGQRLRAHAGRRRRPAGRRRSTPAPPRGRRDSLGDGHLAAAAGDPARDEPGQRQLHRRDARQGRRRLRRRPRHHHRRSRAHPRPPRGAGHHRPARRPGRRLRALARQPPGRVVAGAADRRRRRRPRPGAPR